MEASQLPPPSSVPPTPGERPQHANFARIYAKSSHVADRQTVFRRSSPASPIAVDVKKQLHSPVTYPMRLSIGYQLPSACSQLQEPRRPCELRAYIRARFVMSGTKRKFTGLRLSSRLSASKAGQTKRSAFSLRPELFGEAARSSLPGSHAAKALSGAKDQGLPPPGFELRGSAV